MTEDVEFALEEIANRFEMGGEAVWTSAQVADALRRYILDPDLLLSNRKKDEN
jgi:hypothetical protein